MLHDSTYPKNKETPGTRRIHSLAKSKLSFDWKQRDMPYTKKITYTDKIGVSLDPRLAYLTNFLVPGVPLARQKEVPEKRKKRQNQDLRDKPDPKKEAETSPTQDRAGLEP